MDPGTFKLVFQLATYGPLGLMAAIFVVLFFLSRKEIKDLRNDHKAELKVEQDRVRETSAKLEALSASMISSNEKQLAAITALSKVLDSVDRRLA